MTKQEWQRLADAARNVDAYAALLRSYELPTRIVSAMERKPPPSPEEARQIIGILTQMIECKWSLPPATDEATRRMVEVAHDWALDTLLDATALPVPTYTPSPALRALRRHACVYASEEPVDIASAVGHAIVDNAIVSVEHVTDILETCAIHIDDDGELLPLTESVLCAHQGGVTLGERMRKWVGDRMDSLSLDARACLWASDAALWTGQLAQWLMYAHESPFLPITDVLGFGEEPHAARRALARFSHLYVVMSEWFATHGRQWLHACRSIELVCVLSQCLRCELDHRAFGRKLLSRVPRFVQFDDTARRKSTTKRRFLLASLHDALQSQQQANGRSVYEYMGVIECPDMAQQAIAELLDDANAPKHETPINDVVQVDARATAALVLGYLHTPPDRDDDESARIEAKRVGQAIRDTIAGLGAGQSVGEGVHWLHNHRSEFAADTLPRLRVAWNWLLLCCTTKTISETLVADTLESIEYTFRRYAPPPPQTTPFQVEVVATFLVDLESRVTHSHDALEQQLVTSPLIVWLRKIVRLLQLERARTSQVLPDKDTKPLGDYTEHLERRLVAMMERG